MNSFVLDDSVTNLKRTTCEHTQLLKQTGGLSSYASVQANLISCCIKSTRGLKVSVVSAVLDF